MPLMDKVLGKYAHVCVQSWAYAHMYVNVYVHVCMCVVWQTSRMSQVTCQWPTSSLKSAPLTFLKNTPTERQRDKQLYKQRTRLQAKAITSACTNPLRAWGRIRISDTAQAFRQVEKEQLPLPLALLGAALAWVHYALVAALLATV